MTKYTIQYRQLKTDDLGEDANLRAMLVDSMRYQHKGQLLGESAKARIIDLDQDESYVILNKITDASEWDGKVFSGQLIHLQKGANVAAVLQSLEDDTVEYLLEQVHLGEKASVVKGVLYFAAVDNHVGLIEGQQVKGRTLERYLTALLQKTSEIEPPTAIILNGSFRAADGKELSSSTEISVRAEPNRGAQAPDDAGLGRIVEREVDRIAREGATVFEVLRTLGWDEKALEGLQNEVPDDGWIEGWFKVAIKRRGRKKPISRATINEALRNIDPADIGLDGDGRERGGIVKLSTKRTVATIGALKDPEDAVEQIVNALREWALAGKIDCTFDD